MVLEGHFLVDHLCFERLNSVDESDDQPEIEVLEFDTTILTFSACKPTV